MQIKLNNFSKGLALSGPADRIPEGYARRYRGISPISEMSVISRDGSTLLYSLNAHCGIYFASNWYFGVSTAFYQGSSSIKTGLSGDRLAFATMAPVAGLPDFLLVAGGGELFKVDSSGNVTSWGISAPANPPTLADGGAGGSLDDGAVYSYAVTFLNSSTGHRSNPNTLSGETITTDFVVLLHFEGALGSSTVTNTISGGPSFTASGSFQIAGRSKFGGASGYFNNAALTASDDDDFYFAADFTIALWIYPRFESTSYFGLFDQYEDADNYMSCYWDRDNDLLTFEVIASSATIVSLTYSLADWAASWKHIAITRNSTSWRLFVDGVLVDSATNANSYPNLTGDFRIGKAYVPGESPDPSLYFTYLDEFVIVNGASLYDAGFELPELAFGLNEVDLSGGSTSIDLTNIPQPIESEVDIIELWRTQGGGSAYFKLVGLTVGTTTYTDNASDDDLLDLELPVDNLKPYSWFDDCYGPWNGSMFWITRTQTGERGRVYYSPIGRAESVQGFIEVSSDDDGLQRIISYAGNLFVLSKSRAFQIYGTNPYFSREIAGISGTNAPHTVINTPFGPIWDSQDGVRIFSGGAQSTLVAYDQIKPIMRGKAVGNLTSFTGVVATFARGEYIISDGSQTLAINLERSIWRDLGVGCNALIYSPPLDKIAASISSTVLDFEKEGDTDDNSTAIPFALEPGHLNFTPPVALEFARIDANANGETIDFSAIFDDSAASQGNLTSTAGRRHTEFDLGGQVVNRFGARLSGSLSDTIEINEITLEYWPLVLILIIDGTSREIPGRLSSGKASLLFEDFPLESSLNANLNITELLSGSNSKLKSLQTTYVFERLFYDINANSNSISFTLSLIDESDLSMGTLSGASRTIDEINIAKKGRFQKLTITGDFTQTIAIRRLELIARSAGRKK